MIRPGKRWASGLAAVAIGTLGWGGWWQHQAKVDRVLADRMAKSLQRPSVAPSPCHRPEAPSLVLLVLGQSNAGNHGGELDADVPGNSLKVAVLSPMGCVKQGDPLPNATGQHHSIWTRIAPALARGGIEREVVLALLAIDSTTIDDWTRVSSPVRAELATLLRTVSDQHLRPVLVLWQQGESDARAGTSSRDYIKRFEKLRRQIRDAGVDAPWMLARSTRCRNASGAAIWAAQDELVRTYADLHIGPDLDKLAGPMLRSADCHFTDHGLTAAATAWASSMLPQLLNPPNGTRP